MINEEKIASISYIIKCSICDKDKATIRKFKEKIQKILNQYPVIGDLQRKSNNYSVLCKNKKFLTIKYAHLNNVCIDYQNYINHNKKIGTIEQDSKNTI